MNPYAIPSSDSIDIDNHLKAASQSAESTSLVNTANIPVIGIETTKNTKRKLQKYLLRSVARTLLTDANMLTKAGNKHRTRTCGMHRRKGERNVTIKLNKNPEQSNASIGNTQSCTCLWGCPICYERIAMENAEKILKVIHWAKTNNHFTMMIALTASHKVEMPLEFSERTFKAAWDKFNKSYAWKKFKKDYGVSHFIHNVDITYTLENGWHYHKHLLLILDHDKADVTEAHEKANEILTKLWQHQLKTEGRGASEEHGLYVSDENKSPSDYIAKTGITVDDNGKLQWEMTSNETKDSFNIWSILNAASKGDNHAEKLYLEYVKVMTGKNWMAYGQSGLQKIIEEIELPEPEGDAEQVEEQHHWLKFSDYWWDIVKLSNGDARIIDVAAKTRSIDAIRELLETMRIDLIYANKLSDYYEKFIPIENSVADMRIHDDWTKT